MRFTGSARGRSVASGPSRSRLRTVAARTLMLATALPVAAGSVASASSRSSGRLPAQQLAAEIGRYLQHELHLARADQFVCFCCRFRPCDDVEIVGVLHSLHDAAREDGVILREEGGGQVLWIGIDRVAEEHELHHGHAEHHRESQPVAPHLNEFLADHRAETKEREASCHRITRNCRRPTASCG